MCGRKVKAVNFEQMATKNLLSLSITDCIYSQIKRLHPATVIQAYDVFIFRLTIYNIMVTNSSL